MDSPFVFLLLLLLVVALHPLQNRAAFGELILEDGYTVNTVVDGDKSNVKVRPYSILHQPPPSDLFVLLDHVASTFYTVSMPASSNNIEIERLAGNGKRGYADGDLNSATFDKPQSFAIDFSGNVYVADQSNHAIRKITKSGVTTIAGGHSHKFGKDDGPAQNASFSNEFWLAFVPERCALMITEHGTSLVRQIKLNAADCTLHSGSVLGTTSVLILAVGLSCIFGIIVGFVIRPYVIQYEGIRPHHRRIWTRSLMTLERQIVMLCSVIKSAVVKSPIYSLLRQVIVLSFSLLSLMFRPAKVDHRTAYVKPVSLLDLDDIYNSNSSSSSGNSCMVISPEVDNQLKDLLNFDGGSMFPVSSNAIVEQEQVRENTNVSSAKHNNIEDMILANLEKFEEQVPVNSHEPSECSLGLINRRATKRQTHTAF